MQQPLVKNTLIALKLILCLVLISACAETGTGSADSIKQQEQVLLEADLHSSSVISVKAPQFSLPSNAVLAWREPLQLIGLADEGRQQRFTETINAALEQRGFAIGTAEVADYLIAARIIVGDVPETDFEFMLDPGVISHSGELEKGSLVMILDKPFRRVDWRGSVQILTSMTLPLAERQQRANAAVNILMDTLQADMTK